MPYIWHIGRFQQLSGLWNCPGNTFPAAGSTTAGCVVLRRRDAFFQVDAMETSQNAILPPGYEGITFERVWATLQENAKRHEEIDRLLKEQSQETDRRLKEQSQEADRRLKEQSRLLKEQSQEADRRLKEQSQEADRLLKEQAREADQRLKENERLLRENQKLMGDLGRKFGTIIEHMFIPGLKQKFNALGYEFTKAGPNQLIEDKEHNLYMELDVFLENGDCALAVEVKTQANIGDVREHIGRMKKLRRYFDLRHDQRKLYGAVAAAVMPDNVRDYAFKQGFYVIKQSGDNVSVEAPWEEPKVW
jgi:hypothetical protein